MSSIKDEKDAGSRREFFQGVASGAAGATAMAAALSQIGVPVLNAAQGTEVKPKPESEPGTITLPRTPEGQPYSPFFRNSPPWPKGTEGHKYDHLFCTKLKEESSMPGILADPQIYFRGDSDMPGSKVTLGWQVFLKPVTLVSESHHHAVDEYQFFLGATFPDIAGSFDAEIEIFIGPKYERHIIKEPTAIYLPAGLIHNPLDIRRVTRPLFFTALLMAPFYNNMSQTKGFQELRSAKKID